MFWFALTVDSPFEVCNGEDSLLFFVLFDDYLGFEVLVSQNKKFQDLTAGLFYYFLTFYSSNN